MNFVALDISASSTGWAIVIPGDIRSKFDGPNWLDVLKRLRLSRTSTNWRYYEAANASIAHGAWRLKTEWSRDGDPHYELVGNLETLRAFSRFEHIVYEMPLSQQQRGGASNASNDILVELVGCLKLFRSANRIRTMVGIHRASWQKDFIGSQKRGTKRPEITALYQQRAKQLGFTFNKDDEAAAIGLLTYGLLTRNITPPWISNEVLRPALAGVR